MARLVLDTFGGTDNDTLEVYNPAWAKVTGATGSVIISGSRARHNSTTTPAVYYRSDVTPTSADYAVSANIIISAVSASATFGPCGRMSASAVTMYQARITGSTIILGRFMNGAAATISSAAYTQVAGTTLKLTLRMEGNQLSVLADDVLVIGPITDGNIASAGLLGFRSAAASTNMYMDDFAGDDFVAASSPVTGTISSTLGGASPAASGVVSANGALASLLGGASLSASGSAGTVPAGAFATTLSGTSASMAGTLANPGALASTLGDASLSATGALTATGSFTGFMTGARMVANGSLAMNVNATLGSTLDGASFAAGGYAGDPPEQAKFFQRLPKNPRHYLPLQ